MSLIIVFVLFIFSSPAMQNAQISDDDSKAMELAPGVTPGAEIEPKPSGVVAPIRVQHAPFANVNSFAPQFAWNLPNTQPHWNAYPTMALPLGPFAAPIGVAPQHAAHLASPTPPPRVEFPVTPPGRSPQPHPPNVLESLEIPKTPPAPPSFASVATNTISVAEVAQQANPDAVAPMSIDLTGSDNDSGNPIDSMSNMFPCDEDIELRYEPSLCAKYAALGMRCKDKFCKDRHDPCASEEERKAAIATLSDDVQERHEAILKARKARQEHGGGGSQRGGYRGRGNRKGNGGVHHGRGHRGGHRGRGNRRGSRRLRGRPRGGYYGSLRGGGRGRNDRGNGRAFQYSNGGRRGYRGDDRTLEIDAVRAIQTLGSEILASDIDAGQKGKVLERMTDTMRLAVKQGGTSSASKREQS